MNKIAKRREKIDHHTNPLPVKLTAKMTEIEQSKIQDGAGSVY